MNLKKEERVVQVDEAAVQELHDAFIRALPRGNPSQRAKLYLAYEGMALFASRYRRNKAPLLHILSRELPLLNVEQRSYLLAGLVERARHWRAMDGVWFVPFEVKAIARHADAAYGAKHCLEELGTRTLGIPAAVTIEHIHVVTCALTYCLEGSPAPFVATAGDLAITRERVSQIVKHVETHLGLRLFKVGPSGRNRIGLATEAGEQLFLPFQEICSWTARVTNYVFSDNQTRALRG